MVLVPPTLTRPAFTGTDPSHSDVTITAVASGPDDATTEFRRPVDPSRSVAADDIELQRQRWRHLVVLPAYNEQDSLSATIDSLQRLPEGFDLLVVNDGSTDGTSELAHRLADLSRVPLYVVDLPVNCGIGAAVQTGYRFAQSEGCYRYVIQFDADGQHDATAIPLLVETAEREQLDACIGSRFLSNVEDQFQSTFTRRLGIRFLARLISRLGKCSVTDPTSGMRCVGPRVWQAFAESYPDDYPEPESLYWCIRRQLKVGEVPVRMFPRRGGCSSIHSLKPIYYMLKVTLSILVDRLRAPEVIADGR